MPSAAELIGVGVPAAQAKCLGSTVSTKAGVGLVQATATPITTNLTVLTTAVGQTAFRLPATAVGGGPYIVANTTTTAADIFPPTGNTIQGLGANVTFPVALNKTAAFYKTTATAWVAILSA
jgi:hypothetical protein